MAASPVEAQIHETSLTLAQADTRAVEMQLSIKLVAHVTWAETRSGKDRNNNNDDNADAGDGDDNAKEKSFIARSPAPPCGDWQEGEKERRNGGFLVAVSYS